ncbi:hypothetical protein BDP55DRAFT_560945 [Colletotrichum godetiae]|uniref:Uncharacterized protein n=1 Tax=Colletotrichum godetiae TaxID=1209918 RepID=A0AAJ0ERC6_9PEZI|nr:uncharacterized protein BDP55DRAFT_560945 [Colletotrichum godetiae]KAK1671198.1 hypothetical protein BDP55DRAFT_560945 [Colletotrichum godetiae]
MDHQQTPHDGPSTILNRLAFLPLELQKHIIYDYLTVSSPCLLSLFVPDWAVCARASDPVNEIYDLQRIDVYTKGGGSVQGKYECGVRHGDGHHAPFPLMRQADDGWGDQQHQQHGALLLDELGKRFPVAMDWALRDLGRNGLRVFEQVWPRGHDDGIGRCMASGALVFCEGGRGRGRDADYPRPTGTVPTNLGMPLLLPRHLLFNSLPSDPWLQLRLRRNAVTDFRCEMAFVIERGPEEFVAVDWTAMTQLETLFLDLRTYAAQGGGTFLRDGIRRAAVKMGCLRLRCLVVAGLRTGEKYGRSRGGAWETDEEEVDGEVNWVQVFAPALEEGGRLVFVDRRVGDVDWDAWRVRAEAEELLVPEGERGEGECVTEKYLRHVDRVMGDGE